jgi:hypothetical protein
MIGVPTSPPAVPRSVATSVHRPTHDRLHGGQRRDVNRNEGLGHIGIAQNISAAATDLYLGYRHFDADIKCTDAVGAATCTGGVAAGAPSVTHKLATEGIDVIVMGARVLF